MAGVKTVLSSGLLYYAAASLLDSNFAPLAWGSTALCIWLLFILAKGWDNLQRSDKCHLAWGWTSACAFMVFVSVYDPSFKVRLPWTPPHSTHTRIAGWPCSIRILTLKPWPQHYRLRACCALALQAWGDVYYYCGEQMQYCTCDLRWNLAGWFKAFGLWNFLLSGALAVQKLVIHAGLKGLLPGPSMAQQTAFDCKDNQGGRD